MPAHKMGIAWMWIMPVFTLWGCTSLVGTAVTLPSSAYFSAQSSELESLRSLAHKQEAMVKECRPPAGSCDAARYTMGLVALFANRDDALSIFEELRTTDPNGRFAGPSTRWIQVLQESSTVGRKDTALYALLREEVLHNLLEREEQAENRLKILSESEQERHIAGIHRERTDE